MTNKELQEQLKKYPDDFIILFDSFSGYPIIAYEIEVVDDEIILRS